LAAAFSRLAHTNPFSPDRIAVEKEILGRAYAGSFPVWSHREDQLEEPPNVPRLGEVAVRLADGARKALERDPRRAAGEAELGLYQDLVFYTLFHKFRGPSYDLMFQQRRPGSRTRAPFFADFRDDIAFYLDLPGVRFPEPVEPRHYAALLFQVRRAFHHVFANILGGSLPAARLRAAAWESIFTHDFRRYRAALWSRMGETTTLVTGPSGTGKELVARAISLSRYIPFDTAAQSFDDAGPSFLPLNLAALSPTLIESELFGHRRGSFTGAIADRAGWLEVCPAHGCVFLDEIGDVGLEQQVKLLRVLETRAFQPIGDTETRTFRGKIVAATNRDLPRDIAAGRFREDLYYRLCADTISTPPLRDLLAGDPAELHNVALHLARRFAGPAAASVAGEACAWIAEHLGPDYPWPGNVRELEQCVRNVMIRRWYSPAPPPPPDDPAEALARDVRAGALTEAALLRRYAALVHAKAGTYEELARRLGVDRRTAKSRLEPAP
ncbi:MAG: sigma-54-dependent Fis family transcriptional regulator, partial [Planctomycetia bacterium]|nr:sigma-54-dependent Fis family transcriptional regulator [Planctomycetia bacterium]